MACLVLLSPLSQADLMCAGVPSQYLWFPDENHWVTKPGNSRLWHDTVLRWIRQWVQQ